MIAALLPLTPSAITDMIHQNGILVYLLVFLIVMLAATIIGGPIPNNTFLLVTGAVAMNNGLSLLLLFVMAALGAFTGYEINYWGGKFFGLALCRGSCPAILHDKKVDAALSLMDRFGATAFLISRFLPVMNVPSFIAGVNAMEHRRYVVFNLASAGVWCATDLLVGYHIGGVPFVSANISALAGIFVVILSAAIILALGIFVRDYVRWNGRRTGE